jgi:Family of unknown function (DUF5681)
MAGESSNTSEPDDTGDKQALTRFKPGKSGNPSGRPKGSRSKLATDFTDALADDFAEHGVAAIEKLRQTDNTNYLKIISNVLPREVMVKAFSVNLDIENPFKDDASMDDILETVAKEAGPEAAAMLASMFGLEMPESISKMIEGEPPMIDISPEAEASFRCDPRESNPFDPETDPANFRDWNRRHLGDFDGFTLNDAERAARIRSLK